MSTPDDDVAEAEVYINEDDAQWRRRKVPIPHDSEHYARMARVYGLISVAMAAVHIVLYILGRAG